MNDEALFVGETRGREIRENPSPVGGKKSPVAKNLAIELNGSLLNPKCFSVLVRNILKGSFMSCDHAGGEV